MIDIHHHCLPGVDDGPRDLEEAVALCRLALEEGVDTIIATPHVLRGRWQNTSTEILAGLLAQLQAAVGQHPQLFLGSEYFFAHDIAEILETNGGIIPLAGSRYLLIEFAAQSIPPLIEQPFYRLQLGGWTPIIAHPERNAVFQARPDLLAGLIQKGARTQITCGSLLGAFGETAMASATSWLRLGMVHFVATDSHNVTRRPPLVMKSLAALAGIVGKDVAHAMTVTNPAAVLANEPLPYEPDISGSPATGRIRDSIRSFFRRRE